jgi:DNA-binding transcriptional LysR family regulator
VRCFTVIAEHRHLGRAAEVLHTIQPSLSRQIRRLEQQVGARLLDRSTHGTRLSGAGEVFLTLARELLRAAVQATARIRDAVRPRSITIGYTRGLVIASVLRAVLENNPGAEVHTRLLGWNASRVVLLGHRVVAVVTGLPFPVDQLRVRVLYGVPRVLVVPRDHSLAGKEIGRA